MRCADCEASWFVPAPEPVTNLLRRTPSPRAGAPVEDDQLFDIVDPDAPDAPDAPYTPDAPDVSGAPGEPASETYYGAAPSEPARANPLRRGAAAGAGKRADARATMVYDDEDRRWYRGRGDHGDERHTDDMRDRGDDASRGRGRARPVLDAHFEDAFDDADDAAFANCDAGNNSYQDNDGERADDALAFNDDGLAYSDDDDALRSDADGRAPGVNYGRRAGDLPLEELLGADGDDDGEGRPRGFGRRLREERRRSTALTRIDHFDEAAERVFNDEFFKALHVQPKTLEKAIRKARRRAEAREKNRLTPLRALGWLTWVGVLAASIFVLYTYREPIVNAWPNARAAYAAIGIEAEPKGLKIKDVAHRLAASTRGPSLEITGRLVNDSEEVLPAPLMQAEALASDGALLARWTFDAAAEEIAPGASADFMTRAVAPQGVAEIILTFAPTTPRPRVGPGGALDGGALDGGDAPGGDQRAAIQQGDENSGGPKPAAPEPTAPELAAPEPRP